MLDALRSAPIMGASAGAAILALCIFLMVRRASRRSSPAEARPGEPASPSQVRRERLKRDLDGRIKEELGRQAREREERRNRRRIDESWMRFDRERLSRMAQEEAERQRREAEKERKRAEGIRRPGRAKDRRWALEILGADDGASPEEIRKAYLAGMKDNHPDQAGDVSDTVRAILSERAKLLNIAYDMLKTRKARA